ncbi:MAG: chemotaxis protein CheA [Steroidobacteraceae bacterium]
MSIDLTQFHETFYEESFEALGSMEESLLKLDVGAPEAELINTIFRVAHSIKGGAATFGFAEIASFTHTLETLLDELRSHRMQVTDALMDLLLKSVDVMRDMLRAQQAKQPIDAQRVADLQFDLSSRWRRRAPPRLRVRRCRRAREGRRATACRRSCGRRRAGGGVARRGLAATAPAGAQPAAAAAAVAAPAALGRRKPGRLRDPLQAAAAAAGARQRSAAHVRRAAPAGELRVRADADGLPLLAALDPENCHLAWQLELDTTAPRAAVAEVFDWAEGDCELSIEPLPARPAAPAIAAVQPAVPVPSGSAAAADSAAGAHAEPAAPHHEERAGRTAEAPKGLDATSIRVSIEKIDHLMNSVGELVITQSMLGQFAALVPGADGERLRAGLAQLERNVRELQESVMRVRMVPISFVFSRFPRMVRDLSHRLGKQVELKMSGGETELDKTVLEKIGDRLVHLVRNCVDHGVEMPDVRTAAGKPPGGTVHLTACHRGSSIQVEVRDDGGGLKRDRILAKARASGLVGPDEVPSDADIDRLIFMAGFSTADQATDISGRGVGMDVVRRNVEDLGGSIEVSSEAGKGSSFTITLPLTLAIVDGQTVAVGEDMYIVPLTAIVESLQMRTASINRLGGRGEVLSFRGEFLPVVRLNQVFHGNGAQRPNADGLVMVIEGDGRRVGLCVDELLGQQQVVVKTLEDNYGHVDGIAGATILGDGAVALILDVGNLTRTATGRAAA